MTRDDAPQVFFQADKYESEETQSITLLGKQTFYLTIGCFKNSYK